MSISFGCGRKAALRYLLFWHTRSWGTSQFARSYVYKSSGPAVMVVCPTSMRYPSGSRM